VECVHISCFGGVGARPTVHVLLAAGVIEQTTRLGWQPSHMTRAQPVTSALTPGSTGYSIPRTTNPEPIFFGASDASFADNPSTRASSDGYLFKLFGMPVDWKATKQQSVAKSTTEAELYTLSCTASELIWWNNLFDQLNFKTGITPVIYCNNK
jgi:hypothetical protein